MDLLSSAPGQVSGTTVDHPIVWLIKRRGLLNTSLGVSTVKLAVGPGLSAFDSVLPVTTGVPSAAAKALGLPESLSELDEARWQLLLKRASQLEDERALAHAYVAAATAGVTSPALIRCRVGTGFDDREPPTVAVTADTELAHVFKKAGDPHICVQREAEAELLVDAWGLRSDREAVRSEIGYTPVGEEDLLIDLFPMLRYPLDDAQQATTVLRCSELRIDAFTDAGRTSTPRMIVADGTRIYRHTDLGDADFLREVSSRFGLELDDAKIAAIINNLEDQRTRKLREAISDADDDKTRVLLAIGAQSSDGGSRPHSWTQPRGSTSGTSRTTTSRNLLSPCMASRYSSGTRTYSRSAVSNPPGQWAGRRNAVAVRNRSRVLTGLRRVREADASGHARDRRSTRASRRCTTSRRSSSTDTRRMLRGEGGANRGLISLPTGAGKTRVTVEALVNAMADGEVKSPILWIAQTEELCEQAVQTWSEIWQGLGPRRRLTLSRLWGGYEASGAEYGEQVVVATIQKLDAGVFAKPSYHWLSDTARALVIDEAHSSIGDSYERLLRWQGRRENAEQVPLIGLTATPFRNTNIEETERSRRALRVQPTGGSGSRGETAYPQAAGTRAFSVDVDHEVLPGQTSS